MSVKALRKQLDGDGKISSTEETKQMSEKSEIEVRKQEEQDHWHKKTIYLEGVGCAVSSLGELMAVADNDRLDEYTMQGLGHLLKILGGDVLDKSIDCYDLLKRSPKTAES